MNFWKTAEKHPPWPAAEAVRPYAHVEPEREAQKEETIQLYNMKKKT